jgi:hypothetical protein
MQRVLSFDAHAVHDFEALVALVQQLEQLFRWVLQIAVHLDDPATGGAQDARLDRGLLAVVAREANELHASVARGERAHDRCGRVAAAVVDEDDLPRFARALEHGDQALGELADVALLVVDGDDDRMPGSRALVHWSADNVSSNADTTRSTWRSVSCG